MIGLLGGLGAALAWATTALTAAVASRVIGATATLAWVMVFGLIVIAPTLAFIEPGSLSAHTIGWLVVAGIGNVAGLWLEYRALRVGPVGVVAAICSTEGAIATVIAALTGQVPSAGVLATLAVIAIGIVLASAAGDDQQQGDGERNLRLAVGLSLVTAVLFGVNLYALARASDQTSVVWALWPARLVGTVAVALPLAMRGRLRLPGPVWPYALGSGVAEVVGILAYALGARHGIAIPAVLGSQFGGLAALGARLLLGERLGRVQIAGLVTIGVGVAVLAALRA